MPRTGRVEVVIRFRGADFDTWKATLDAHEPARVRHGAVGHWISRSIGDPNEFIGVVEFTSLGGARDYVMGVDRLDVDQAVMIEGGPHNRTWDEAIYETVDTATYRQ
jgi:hypothetical protein